MTKKLTIIRKFCGDKVIQWNGDNFNEIRNFIPEKYSLSRIDSTTLIFEGKYEVFIGYYFIQLFDIINDRFLTTWTFSSPEKIKDIYDIIEEEV